MQKSATLNPLTRRNLTPNPPMNKSTPPLRRSPCAGIYDKDISGGNDGIGYRSPCVGAMQSTNKSPATHGHSVREFEEQMSTLRKENFNLKLRLYFIEESLPSLQRHAASADGNENIMRQLIDTKVEMEILRKEMQDKQDLLKDAAKAMTQLEDLQRDTEAKSQEIVENLQQRIEFLESERNNVEKYQQHQFTETVENEFCSTKNISENLSTLQKLRDLQISINDSERKIVDYQNRIAELDETLAKRDEEANEFVEKVKSLTYQNMALKEDLDAKKEEAEIAERTIRALRVAKIELAEENDQLINQLKSSEQKVRTEMLNMHNVEHEMRDQQTELRRMETEIATKTAHASGLLERIQEYERMVTKTKHERNLATSENHFFRTIIQKLGQVSGNNVLTIEQRAIYEPCGSHYDRNNCNNCNIHNSSKEASVIAACKHFNNTKPPNPELSRRHDYNNNDFTGSYQPNNNGYEMHHQLCVNYRNDCSHANMNTGPPVAVYNSQNPRLLDPTGGMPSAAFGPPMLGKYLHDCYHNKQCTCAYRTNMPHNHTSISYTNCKLPGQGFMKDHPPHSCCPDNGVHYLY